MIRIAEANCNRAVMDAVKEACAGVRLPREAVVVVPDSYTLSFEREIMSELSASFEVSVVTFRRLLNRLLKREHRYLDGATGTMAVRAVLSGLEGKLAAFGRSVKFSSFSEKMYELIAGLKNCGISPAALEDGAGRASGVLRAKLSDVARIYSGYEALKGEAADASDLFALLPGLIAGEPAFRESVCLFAGFDIFSKLGEEVFAACARAFSETVFFANDTDKPPFAPILLSSQIAALCRREGLAFRTEKIARPLSPFSAAAARALCSKREVKPSPAGEGVRFFIGTREEEAEYAARNIRKLLSEGFRRSEIAVVLSDAEAYRTPLARAFSAHGIAYWMDEKYPLSEHPYSRWFLSGLAAGDRGWAQEDVLELVKNLTFYAFFPEEEREGLEPRLDAFENYVLKFGIAGKRFFSPFELSDAKNPELRARAEEVRLRLVEAAGMFEGNLIRNFLAFLDRTDLPVMDAGSTDPLFAAYSEQAPGYLRALLHSIENVFGSPGRELLFDVLRSGLERQKISEIPLCADSVFCGEKESVQFMSFRALFVLGMNEGEFPAVTEDGGVLNDRDIEALSACGIAFYPRNSDNNLRVRFSVLKLLTNDYERRFFSCTLSARPSETFAELTALCGGEPEELEEDLSLFSSPHQRRRYACQMFHRARAGERLDYGLYAAICEYAETHDAFLTMLLTSYRERWEEELPPELAGRLFYPERKTSISSVETYYRCPFRHFLQYGLRARERETAEMKALNIGNILHLTLQYYVEGGQFTPEAVEPAFLRVFEREEYAKYRADERFRPILTRLLEESEKVCRAVAGTFARSDFRNAACELKFGMEDPIRLEGTEIRLEGVIDRVDILERGGETLCRVIDYKSGRAEFEETDLYFGRKVQLFVYLYALERQRGWRPAGAYYFPVHNKFTEDTGTAYRLRGVTVEDREVLLASDFTLGEGRPSEILDARPGKDGETIMGRNLLEAERLGAYVDYAAALCREAVRAASSGDIRMLPARGACDSCAYRTVCRNFEGEGARSGTGWDRPGILAALAGGGKG